MEHCLHLFTKLTALCVAVIMGYSARRFLRSDIDTIASLIFYIVAPVVFFSAVAKIPFEYNVILLPFFIALISSVICLSVYFGTKRLWPDNNTRSILAFSSCNSNVGYFILPITWELFSDSLVGLFVIMVIGNALYENTVGFFIAARGNYSAQESLKRIIRLPSIYALILGIIFSSMPFLSIPPMFDDFIASARGCYSILGMMMVGIGLADIKGLSLDKKFISFSFLIKFIAWPLVTALFIFLDKFVFHLYNEDIYKMFMLFSAAPLAANNIVISTVLKSHPEKVASAVLSTTIFALLYVPLFATIFIK
jgi:malate permease and related proteins